MRTILATLLLWAFATIALCIAGLWLTAKSLERGRAGGKDPVTSLIAMLGEDARRAFDEGGSAGLSTHLRQVAAKLPGERFLVDSLHCRSRLALSACVSADQHRVEAR